MRKLVGLLLLLPFFALAQKKQITLEDIYRLGTFRGEFVPGFQSMQDGNFYVETTAKGIVQKSFLTNVETAVLVANSAAKDENGKALDLGDFELSADEKKVLLAKDREFIYRHSSKAFVYVHDRSTNATVQVDKEKVMHASFNNDGSKVAFVKNNNLMVRDLVAGTTTAITKDGEWNKIINGNCDWVYEEEFSMTHGAFNWSNNGQYIAYYRFDESKVPVFNMAMYEGLYPADYSYKYPKAGDPNSEIEIHVYELATGKDVKVDIGTNKDIYIPRISWTNDNQLCVQWLNRLQNHLKYLLANPTSGTTKLLYEEKNKYYVDITDDLKFLADGKQFIHTSEKDGYLHVYLYGMDGLQKAEITPGKFDVAGISYIDEKNKRLYFTAGINSPMDRQLYVVDFQGKKRVQVSQGAGWHNVTFNSNGLYYLDNYSTLNTPATISIMDSKGKLVKQLKDNAPLKAKLQDYDIATATFLKVPNSKNDSLNCVILKPNNFDPSKKYPVLFCNYGGPGSQEVVDRYGSISFWHQLLAQKGYIIVKCDNTGTGARGEEFKKKTYLRMGDLETQDQVDVAKYLAKMPWVDGNRIGHWGWSYGGFMSSLAITQGAEIFKAAVAVAPVTNWRYYDNIYTERFMRTPQENGKNYDATAPLSQVGKIKGKFLIIHGTADDNVHFQNSVMMVDEMVKKNIDFESAYYPNKNHGIRGGNTSYHLYRKMTNWIIANL
jgi:dipeptidyl-peptidase 4